MDNPDELKAVLVEIRDLQRELLQEYKTATQRSIALQETSVKRQAAAISLYRRAIVATFVVVIAIVAGLVLSMSRPRGANNMSPGWYYGPVRSPEGVPPTNPP